MLDLTALEARFRNLSLFGCKAAGGRCLYSNLRTGGMEKNTGAVHEGESNRKDRDWRNVMMCHVM